MLATETYQGAGRMQDTDAILHLGWTSDERDCLAIDICGLLQELLAGEAQTISSLLCYPVVDPFYEDALSEAVARFFARPSLAARVSCAAGVNSILHCLASFPECRVAGVAAPVYPDFPHWLELSGRQPVSLSGADLHTYAGFLDNTTHSVLFLERPSFTGGGAGQSIDELRALCMIAARRSNTVVIDESNANYLEPQASGVMLVDEVPNLVIVRGFSKAYGLGGIRLGYCVASAAIAPRLRCVMPPLLASTLSVEIGRQLLIKGDICAPLRARIRQNKPQMAELLRATGIEWTVPVDHALPYLALADGDAGIDRLKRVGVVGKRHAIWVGQGAVSWVYRLSVPLSPVRFDDFSRRCAALAVESTSSARAVSMLQ